jgi:transposase
MTIPGVGPVTASAIVATIQDARAFASGREFAAFLGLTPRQNSSGGKERLGRITKMGAGTCRRGRHCLTLVPSLGSTVTTISPSRPAPWQSAARSGSHSEGGAAQRRIAPLRG